MSTLEQAAKIVQQAAEDGLSFPEAMDRVWSAMDLNDDRVARDLHEGDVFLDDAFSAARDLYQLRTWTVRYTVAPADYDGFGTRELDHVYARGFGERGKTYRKVLIDPRHLSWQESRFHSGLGGSYDEGGMVELIKIGRAVKL